MRKILSVLCIVCLFAGCGKEAGTPEETGASQIEAAESQEQEKASEPEVLDEESEKEFRDLFEVQAEGIDYLSVEGLDVPQGASIAMIGKDSGSGFWKKVREGAAAAAADLNEALGYTGNDRVKLIYDAPDGEDVAEQIDIIDQMLDKCPDALCIGFVDINSGKTQLELARNNGIPVLAVDSGIENSLLETVVSTDNYEAGTLAAQEICEAIGDVGEVALLVHSSQTETGIDREKGFVEEIERNHPGVQVVDVAYAQQDERSVDEIVAAVLKEHPDLKAYFGTNDTSVRALLDALELLRPEETAEDMALTVAGFDASNRQMEAVVGDRMIGVLAQNPYAMGYASAVAAFRAAAGLENAAVVDTGYMWLAAADLEEPKAAFLIYK